MQCVVQGWILNQKEDISVITRELGIRSVD